MSANRMKLKLGTRCSEKEISLSLATSLHPQAINEAVESLSIELKKLANNKEGLKNLLENIAEDTYNDYLKAIKKLRDKE